MNILALFLAATDEGGQVARTFGVDWSHFGAQIISFCIVCFLLYRFAYGPILKMLEERRQQIAQGLANNEKIKADLARTEVQRQEVMMRADADANTLIEEAHVAAARVREQEIQKATAAAEQIVVKARVVAAQDYDRMLTNLKSEVGRLVLKTTATLAGKILTPEDERRLAEETTSRLAA